MSKRRRYTRIESPKLPPINLTITEVSRGGAGIGRDNTGRAIFVPFTAPGDEVNVRLHKVKQSYAEGEILELVKASPIRIKPPCPAFTRCGGCQWQHLPYELQWSTKCNGVAEALRRVGINKPLHWDEYPSTIIWEYRNRIQLRGKGSKLGFYSGKSHQLISITHCDIAHPKINDMIRQLNEHDNSNDTPYKIELYLTPEGSVKSTLNNQHAAEGFSQVNNEQNNNLQSWIKQSIGFFDGIFDLYGGSGNLSIPLADMAKEIHCVDLNIADSKASAGHHNVHLHNSAVVPWLERRLEEISNKKTALTIQHGWLAIIDPPRSGLGKDASHFIHYLEKLQVNTVVLVGCKTDPWARDLSKFIEKNWRLNKVAVFDFFPQTYHVESAAILSRNK